MNKFTVGLIVLRVAMKLLRLFVIGIFRMAGGPQRYVENKPEMKM